jgi:hypothetical protein
MYGTKKNATGFPYALQPTIDTIHTVYDAVSTVLSTVGTASAVK